MSKKFTTIVVTLLALLVTFTVPASAQKRPDPKTLKHSVMNRPKFDQKVSKKIHSAAPKLNRNQRMLSEARFVKQNNIQKADIKKAGLNPLYAHVVYDDNWIDSYDYGIYSIMPTPPANLDLVIQHGYLDSYNGGAIIDNKYYVHYYWEFFGYIFFFRECYDLETGEAVELDDTEIDIIDLASCTSYDSSRGLSYGIFYNESGSPTDIASYDYLTKSKQVIATTSNSYLVCAVDGKGSLFAITLDGDLYKIDLSTGNETFVGSTGLEPMYQQSATIDPSSGTMYWAFLNAGMSALYQVNTETAEVSEVFAYDRLIEISYLQSMAPDADNDAPAAVENLVASVSESDPTTLEVSFTMPTTTVGDDPLIGELQYTIDLNGTVYDGNAQPGEGVSRSIEGLASGMYTVLVRAINAVGNGASNKVSLWVGFDQVKAPDAVELAVDEAFVATVTWTPVTEGIHAGYVNPDEVTYRVTRYPEGEVVADGISENTFSETVSSSPLRVVYYSVQALYNGAVSQPAESNGVRVGSSIVPSYTYDFNGSDNELWTVIDVNGDGRSWVFSIGSAYYSYSTSLDADDWLLTPPLSLKAGKKYLLSFNTRCASSTWPERIEVGVGQGLDPSTYDIVVDPVDVDFTDFRGYSEVVSVDADGDYYIGFHAISDADAFNLYVADFALIDGSTPGAAENIVAVAGERGALNATINFNAPTKTSGGDELSNITKIEVKRAGTEVAVIENPAVGAALSVYDDAIEESGTYNYTIQAFNEDGSGVVASTNVYVGLDTPGAPEVLAVYNNPGITLSWEASTVGTHGGYVDPSEVTYQIYGVEGGYLTDMIAEISETTFVDAGVNLDEEPVGWKQYVIYAVNSVGTSNYGIGALIAGAPEGLPFIDSFDLTPDQSALVRNWFIASPNGANWNITTAFSSDGDNVCGIFQSPAAGALGYLYTQRISFAGSVSPVAVFKYFIVPGDDIKLSFGYDKQDGNGTIKIADVADGKDITEEGWQTAVVDLSELVGLDQPVVLAYIAEANAAGALLYVDEMRFGDVYAEDIEAVDVTAPKAIQVGESGDVRIRILNNGSNAVEEGSYSVKLYAGNEEVAEVTETPALIPYTGTAEFTVPYVARVVDASPLTLKAEVVYNRDLNLQNNVAQTTVNIRQNKVPAVNDLTATTSGRAGVKLTWSEPVASSSVEPVTEDFEDTEIFQDCDNGGIDWGVQWGQIGGWTLYDGDNYYAYGWSGVTFPGQDKPRAYIVFNPFNYFDLTGSTSLVPYSGDQYLLSQDASVDENYNVVTTDDWLISPALSGNAQTISFYATEITDQYGHEHYQVLYSSTDTNPESFTVLVDDHATTEWEEVTVDLPAGAKYFAIRNISEDVFGLMIDDVTYEPAAGGAFAGVKAADGEVVAYNIYRDNKLIATVNGDVHEYYDVVEEDGLHSYNVTALYGTVESPLSNTVSVVTGIEELQNVENLDNADLTVYGANGVIIARGKGVFNTLRNGVYVIKNNETGDVMGVTKK